MTCPGWQSLQSSLSSFKGCLRLITTSTSTMSPFPTHCYGPLLHPLPFLFHHCPWIGRTPLHCCRPRDPTSQGCFSGFHLFPLIVSISPHSTPLITSCHLPPTHTISINPDKPSFREESSPRMPEVSMLKELGWSEPSSWI